MYLWVAPIRIYREVTLMKMKQVLATGAALSMALSMTPVTASAADKVDINVIAAQYGQQTADWWANFVTEFNEANPDINLNVEVVSWNDIYTVVNTRIANGEAPDVLNIDVFADYQADDPSPSDPGRCF